MSSRKAWSIFAVSLIVLFVLSGCGSGSQGNAGESGGGHEGHTEDAEKYETTASIDVLPSFLDHYSPTTKDLYAKAALHKDLLSELYCYCGCMEYDDPHDSLYRCYIAEQTADGVKWTDHSAMCGVCLMEVRDAVKMADEGKSADEIKAYIDATYGGA
ncbi:PCYCGC motif-containing (lipo)protein [Paenibacillus thermotolerans]|uniref:PCYCGC motif-containing (lipo)protein n=1 Tax=Paenibacillus thermotolerans TaxID=3027807 RepID=UPI0023676FAA|nr:MULTISPECIES: PCYCGC motif-containing (lipo)protein [unclassified Paenibacillus]